MSAMSRIVILVRKEWEDLFRQWTIVGSVVLTPLLFAGMGGGTIWGISGQIEAEDMIQEGAELQQLAGSICDGLGELACVEAYMGTIFLLMFMIVPVLIPSIFAAHSVAGERNERTLEPLLATPIETWELLLGKCVAAAIPAIAATWLGAGVMFALLAATASPAAFGRLLSPMWALAILGVGPLLAIFAVLAALMVSSRTSDPRVAQQLSGAVVMPIVLLLIGQSLGLMVVNPTLVAIAAGTLTIANVGMGWLAVQVFEREAILTRWS